MKLAEISFPTHVWLATHQSKSQQVLGYIPTGGLLFLPNLVCSSLVAKCERSLSFCLQCYQLCKETSNITKVKDFFIDCRHKSLLKVVFKSSDNIEEQESPPAWTQEAYRPPCSKYSLCCPNWVPPRQGTPQPGYPLARVPPQPGYPPSQGTPPGRVPPARVPPWPGYLPGWTWQGTPRLPHGIRGNVAKHYGIWVPPPVDRQIDGWMDGWMDGRTDACQNITFPSYYVRGR